MEEIVKISDVIENPEFATLVKKNLHELVMSRLNRPNAKAGFRYKRDWYDRMHSDCVLTSEFFIKHIGDIWVKKSNLNSEFRGIIKLVCDRSIVQLLES